MSQYDEAFNNAKARMSRQGLGLSVGSNSFNEENEKNPSSNDAQVPYTEQALGKAKTSIYLGTDATNAAVLAHGGEQNASSNDAENKYFNDAVNRGGKVE